MAYDIGDFNGTTDAPDSDYPFGNIKDVPNGTVVDVTMMTDLIQTAQKLMALAGITPNGTPDNVSNGYQLIEALTNFNTLSLTGAGDWVDAGSLSIVADNTPLGSMSAYTVDYSKYKIFGKTFIWQTKLSGITIAGAPGAFFIDPPSALDALSMEWSNLGFVSFGTYGAGILSQTFGHPFSGGGLSISPYGGGNFTNGTSQTMNINVIGEVFLNP